MFQRTRFTWGLVTAIIGVYALILAGASTAITDAATTCATWPTCHGDWVSLSNPDLAIVWAHRLTAALVGLVVAGVTLRAFRTDTSPRVRRLVAVAAVAYPLQIAIGAYTATTQTTSLVAALHLGVGLVIFGALVVALAWELEPDTRQYQDHDPTPPDPPQSSTRQPSTRTVDPTLLDRVYGYFQLMKPRLMWLLCLVAAAAMALAAGPALAIDTVILTLGGGVLAIGASGTFNHVLERDRDQAMQRTADRPVVQDQIPVKNAVAWGCFLAVAAILVFLQVNVLAAVLGTTAILYYAVVYTLLLKPNTVQNTVIGGFAGALPALIGVAAVTGTISVAGIALATVVFLWTPAHFYNLALAYRDDYERGGFPMLPVVHGNAVTRKHILYYLGAALGATAVLGWVTDLGIVFAAATTLVGALFLWAVVGLHRDQTRSAAFRAFHASNAFLGTVLIAVLVDSLVI